MSARAAPAHRLHIYARTSSEKIKAQDKTELHPCHVLPQQTAAIAAAAAVSPITHDPTVVRTV